MIGCFADSGPRFGYDFQIHDNCNTATNWANFPYNYNVDGPNEYTECEETNRAFTGAANK